MPLEFTDPDGLDNPTIPTSLAHRYLYGDAVDQILAAENAAGDVLWGLADHQGTIRDVVKHDGQQTVLENHVQYDAFGRITGGQAAADFLFAFTGRPLDPDTGLYDYRARWYDPEVGRFLSEDPIGFAAGDFLLPMQRVWPLLQVMWPWETGCPARNEKPLPLLRQQPGHLC